MGKFELQQATANLKFLQDKLQNKSNAAQYHNLANRMLGDLEFRGHVRPITTEEFNLAANYHHHDVRNAEFYRTFEGITFFGADLSTRLRALKNDHGTDDTRTLKMKKPVGTQRTGDKSHISFEDAYGHRGNAPPIHYLSPWEFTGLWTLEYLKPPCSYSHNAKTMWTPAGLAYKEKRQEDKEAPAPKPGKHYVVIDCVDPSKYIAFPESSATQILRHRAVMVRWKRPHVPQPSATPLPTTHLSEEERCRIFSVYLRPWVLNTEFASAQVPLLADLDIAVSDVLSAQQPHRDL